ncbi:hypothetical protein [Cellulomonas uda]|uniref:HK97 gp10 family phage protein n=1 Tax=Cellulomonas uda TaxID=1714 RepID=A0A4Y3K971_CELUD|nr:hypothetical protein [Cellulomonas uda]NII67819.1 hypothetical protein [Cellulomonas uda]GEA79934.1 hypothetical protein CUD01_03780 [Cellulomonas uda]
MAGGDFEVTGADKLRTLSVKLKAAGDRDITNTLRRELRAGSKETRTAVKRSAIETLPARGGLNRWAATTPGITASLSGRNPSVRITQRKRGHDIAALDAGTVRHPIYGRRKTWVAQDITPGFFTKPIERDADKLRRLVTEKVSDAATRAASL